MKSTGLSSGSALVRWHSVARKPFETSLGQVKSGKRYNSAFVGVKTTMNRIADCLLTYFE